MPPHAATLLRLVRTTAEQLPLSAQRSDRFGLYLGGSRSWLGSDQRVILDSTRNDRHPYRAVSRVCHCWQSHSSIQPCIGGWFLELAPLLLPTLALGLSTALDTFALITAPTSTSSGQYQFGFGVVIGAVAAFMGVLAGEPSKLFEQVLEKRFAGKFDPAGTTQQQDAYRAVNEGAYGASAAGNNGVVGWDWGARRERLSQISLALIGRRC